MAKPTTDSTTATLLLLTSRRHLGQRRIGTLAAQEVQGVRERKRRVGWRTVFARRLDHVGRTGTCLFLPPRSTAPRSTDAAANARVRLLFSALAGPLLCLQLLDGVVRLPSAPDDGRHKAGHSHCRGSWRSPLRHGPEVVWVPQTNVPWPVLRRQAAPVTSKLGRERNSRSSLMISAMPESRSKGDRIDADQLVTSRMIMTATRNWKPI